MTSYDEPIEKSNKMRSITCQTLPPWLDALPVVISRGRQSVEDSSVRSHAFCRENQRYSSYAVCGEWF